MIRGRKGEHSKELDAARKSGYVRVRVDGSIYDLSETIKLDKNKKHNIEVVIDRLVIDEEIRARLADSVETACALSRHSAYRRGGGERNCSSRRITHVRSTA